MRSLSLAILLLCAGCQTRVIKSDIAVIRWSHNLSDGSAWQREIQKHIHRKAVIFVCHGGISWEYQGSGKWETAWYCFPDGPRPATKVESVAWMLRDEYGPDVPIFLLTCNPGHFGLHVPNVYFAPDNVLDMPLHIPFSWEESVSSFEELKWSGWDDFSTTRPSTQPTTRQSN